jgi:UDP-glucose 4-epimerase
MSIKRVLITGSNSYVGTNVEKWLMKEPDKFYVETISVRGDAWKSFDFSKFDVVFHVAGIAHIKETKRNKDLYFKVNKDLAVEISKKAKASGVLHFIFISSMSVFGVKQGIIDQNSIPKPKSFYGQSKFLAENTIKSIESSNFIVSVVRPPMIYGKNCKGNYPRLVNFIKKIHFFPIFNNQRSMLYIYNFTEFIKGLILNPLSGYFHPQNKDYVSTYNMVLLAFKIKKTRIFYSRFFNILFILFKNNLLLKVFGDLVYSKNISIIPFEYNIIDFAKSIHETEIKN